jgi:hypothetical protein
MAVQASLVGPRAALRQGLRIFRPDARHAFKNPFNSGAFMNYNFFSRKAAHWGLLTDNIFESRFNIRTHFAELLGCAQRSRPVRISFVLLLVAVACFAQDPFSALGAGAQTISTGTFVTGCVELAIVVGGILLAFSGRVVGGVLIAIIGGGMLALSATKWMGWIQSL